jgi:glycosyltransferase involved in cell wall biosynthesis
MTPPTGGVVVVHPSKQHVYEVAVALQKAGLLRAFMTGVYYKPAALPYFLVRFLPIRLRARVVRQLEKRRHAMLDAEAVYSWPYAEVLSYAMGGVGWLYRLSRGRIGYPLVNWVTDRYFRRAITRMRPYPAAVYGFAESALATFARARALGITTIVDVPIVVDADEVLRREYRSLLMDEASLPPASTTFTPTLERADWVVAPSPAVADSVERAGVRPRGIFIVPFGADTSLFKPAEEPRAPHGFRVAFAGRIEPRKGLHYLLDAWRDAALDGELVVAGSPGSDREFVARIRRQYAGSFTEAGNLTQPELARLFAACDVFVLPSLAEGSALVTYQALAAGLPCIVTFETGSVVRDGVEGFVIPARDRRALRERLETLSRDVDLRRRMARAAVARGREFTWARYHAELAAVITRVLAETRPAAAAGPNIAVNG